MSIRNPHYSRRKHIGSLWREQLWSRWLSLAWGAIGVFIVLRDEIFQPADEKRWRIINMIPHLSLAWWLFWFAAILVIWVFEASFRSAKKLYAEIGDLQSKVEPSLRLTILGLKYDSDKIYLDFHVKNQGKPTTLKNWELNVTGPDLDVRGLTPDTSMFNNESYTYNGNRMGENLTQNPLETGGERKGTFIYTCHGQQAEKFSQSGLYFELTVEDIVGQKIIARHCT